MTDAAPHRETIARLHAFASAPSVSAAQKQAAQILARRMSAAVRIVVFGPVADANAFLFDQLSRRLNEDTADIVLSVAAPSDGFETADIVLWCSFVFGPDEQRSWSGASDRLQDRSHLIILSAEGRPVDLPDNSPELFDAIHFLPMTAAVSDFDTLCRTLVSRVRNARNADADHAALLLKDFKGAPLFTAPQEAESSLLTQAEQILGHHAQVALEIEEDEDEDYARSILSSCAEVGERLNDHFDLADCPAWLTQLQQEVAQAHDDIVLMSLEGGLSAASDAITRLMELRTKMQREQAA